MSNVSAPPGVTREIAEERNYRRIESTRQLDAYDHQLTDRQTQIPGLLIPVYRLGESTPYTYVLRPDAPRMGQDGKYVKYEWPARVPLCLDVLPRYRAALQDPTIPIWITEGAKKADALASAFGDTIVPIDINGVWGWMRRGKDGASHPIDDLNAIAWGSRRVVLAFDNDVTRKAEVQQALRALERHLVKERGAAVGVLVLPSNDGKKLGVDDALAGGMTPDELRGYVTGLDNLDSMDNLDDLPPDELRRRLRSAIDERDRWKERAEQLQLQLGQVQERNRFVTQASGAEGIGAPAMRLTFVELTKELETAEGDGRKQGDWSKIRPAYMARCTGQNRSTVGRHLDTMQEAGLIEKEVKRIRDGKTGGWCSEMYVRPLVDLSDPSQVSIPSLHGGRRERCPHCQSENVAWMKVKVCRDCERTIGDVSYQAVNPPELHDANQTDGAGGLVEQTSALDAFALNCSVQLKEDTCFSELHHANQKPLSQSPSLERGCRDAAPDPAGPALGLALEGRCGGPARYPGPQEATEAHA